MKVNTQTIVAPIVCQPNTEYDCTGSVLTRTTKGYCFIIKSGTNNVTIKGGELKGGGIKVERTENSIIDGVTVRDCFSGSEGGESCGFTADHFINSTLSNCKFYNMPHTAVWFWATLHKSKITKNYIETCGEGFHSFHRGGVTSEDVQFTYNEVRKCRRHAFEHQNYGICRRWRFTNNIAHDWVTTDSWPGHMAFSIAMGQSDGSFGVEPDKGPAPYINDDMIVRNNVALATGDLVDWFKSGRANPDSSCAFELMGNFDFSENYVDGFPHVTLMEYTRPNKHSYYNNIFLTYQGGKKCYGDTYVGYQSPPSRTDGNYYGTTGDKPIPTNVGPNGETNPVPPEKFFALGVKQDQNFADDEVEFSFQNVPSGISEFNVTCKSSGGGEIGPKVGPTVNVKVSESPKRVKGYHPGWHIDFTATNGNTSNSVLQFKMKGDPTVSWPPVAPANPVVNIVSPVNGATVSGIVAINATASGTGTLTHKIEINNIQVANSLNYSWDTKSFSNGLHAIKITSTDIGGRSGSSSVSVNVSNVAAPQEKITRVTVPVIVKIGSSSTVVNVVQDITANTNADVIKVSVV